MWARCFEIALACWLAMSPFIFRHPGDATWLWTNDLAVAVLIATVSLISFAPSRLEKLHLVNLALGAWLIGVGFLAEPPPPSAPYQNHVTVGLLLMMFAVIPSRSNDPPRPWREFYEKRNKPD